MPRHQEGDPFELVRERLERHFELPAVEQVVERRLQQVEQPVLEQHRVGRRLRADPRLRAALGSSGSVGSSTSCRPAGGFGESAAARRPTGGAGNFQPSVVTVKSSRPSDRTHGASVSSRASRTPARAASIAAGQSDSRSGDSRDRAGRLRRRLPLRARSAVVRRHGWSPPSCGPRPSPRGCGRTARPGRPPGRRGRGGRDGVAVGREASPAAAAPRGARGWSSAIASAATRRRGRERHHRHRRPATAAPAPAGVSVTIRSGLRRRSSRPASCRSGRRRGTRAASGRRGLLHAVRLDGGRQAELQRPAPAVRHQVAAEPPGRFLEHGQEPERDGRRRGRSTHGAASPRVGTIARAAGRRHPSPSDRAARGLQRGSRVRPDGSAAARSAVVSGLPSFSRPPR